MPLANQKRRLLTTLGGLFFGGFLAISFVSYFISVTFLRGQIDTNVLPLTSDNLYSEIQRDLIRPILLSSMMAGDTFLRDWVVNGEQDPAQITKYLAGIAEQHGTLTSFFVSEKTRTYYQSKGVLKVVKPEEPRDEWYFRVREMTAPYEINFDPDLANGDAPTVFINYKVFDYEGNFIGATGVGLALHSVTAVLRQYHDKFNHNVYFADRDGNIVLRSDIATDAAGNEQSELGHAPVPAGILEGREHKFVCENSGHWIHVKSRYIPELKWHLLVTQTESGAFTHVYRTLFINLLICAVITALILAASGMTINVYQRAMQDQQDQLRIRNTELAQKNAELETALGQVKTLSGLLPICASCKCIRNDQGYWQQIDAYVRDHSEVAFSHSICPNCARKLYPEFVGGGDDSNSAKAG